MTELVPSVINLPFVWLPTLVSLFQVFWEHMYPLLVLLLFSNVDPGPSTLAAMDQLNPYEPPFQPCALDPSLPRLNQGRSIKKSQLRL